MQEGARREVMVGRTTYGESQPNPEATNLRGKPFQQRDQAGRITTPEYDFKGNPLSSTREITTDVEPTLDGVAPADLTEQDIEFLTGETGWSREYLSFYATAAKLSQQTKLPTEAFYGLFRQQMPTGLPQLLAQSPKTLRRTLQNAIRENIIPARVGEELDSIMAGIKEQVIEQAFVKPGKDKASLGELIGTSITDQKMQRTIVSRYVEHKGTPEEFWAELRKDERLGDKVDDLQFRNHLKIPSLA
jgi:hypothetical protein